MVEHAPRPGIATAERDDGVRAYSPGCLRSFESDGYAKARASTLAWGHGVVTAYSVFGPDFEIPGLPRWALHDKGDQVHLLGRLRQNAQRMTQGKRVLNHDDIEAIVDALSGRHEP